MTTSTFILHTFVCNAVMSTTLKTTKTMRAYCMHDVTKSVRMLDGEFVEFCKQCGENMEC